jgi:4-amino-4-deoxy-L-arabinose transferase-like glycosyltransferase
MSKNRLALISIFILALLLRLFLLGDLPQGVSVDEASFGYIAYSLAQTRRDEHGVFLPLIFQAFGDQKLPAQAYLLVPSIAIFGLNNFALRLPSALWGSLSVLLIYALARSSRQSRGSGLILALLWALSPATFILSRFAYESNLGLTFFLFGLWGLLDLIKGTSVSKWWAISRWSLGFAGAFYSYIAFRPVVIGLTLLVGGYLYWHKKNRRYSVIIVWLSLFCLLTPGLLLTGKSNVARLGQIGLFADEGVVRRIHEQRDFCSAHLGWSSGCYLFYNKAWEWSKSVLANYTRAFSGELLFVAGDGENYLNVANSGYFSFWLGLGCLLALVSVVITIKRWRLTPWWWLLIWGLLIAPLPAVLAGVQKVRLTPMYPFLFLLAGVGFDFLAQRLRSTSNRRQRASCGVLGLLIGCSLLSSGQCFLTFFTIHPFKNDADYLTVAETISHFLGQVRLETQPIYFNVNYPDPLMLYAYYTGVAPALYQQTAVLGDLEPSGFQHTQSVANLYVTPKPLTELIGDDLDLQTGYYVTHDPSAIADVFLTPESEAIVYTARSDNQALTYGWVVDIARYRQLLTPTASESASEALP